eukprot:m.50303 g.50303  ORF g.50303 m.50303 type:complete len:65 (-) comp11154_c0_seq1:1934-2128(-)
MFGLLQQKMLIIHGCHFRGDVSITHGKVLKEGTRCGGGCEAKDNAGVPKHKQQAVREKVESRDG